jgi:hypothetical protein
VTEQREVRACRVYHRADIHDRAVSHVAVCEDTFIGVQVFYEPFKLTLLVNRNPVGVQLTREGSGIFSVCDVGDLCGCERYYFISRVVPVKSIKIVKIAPCRAYDDDSALMHICLPFIFYFLPSLYHFCRLLSRLSRKILFAGR